MAARSGEYRRIWLLFGILLALTGVILAAVLAARARIPDYVGRELSGAERDEVISRNSPLTEYVFLTSVADFPREEPVRKITIHHMAADDIGLKDLGNAFSKTDLRTSANYGIDRDGHVGLYVEERNRAWSSSSPENDHQAVTIEVANDTFGGDWHVSDESYDALIELCADICRRNGIEELIYTGDAEGNLTIHKMFSDTECPGPYLESKMPEIAKAVNQRLNAD